MITYKKSITVFSLSIFLFALGCSGTAEVAKVEKKIIIKKETQSWMDLDTVKAGKFDTGKMWTFEDAPVDYFEESYGFRPSQEWLDDVQKSALRFATWCTSSFVSADGLIMTNHHCVDFILNRFQEEGEDIAANGFYAPTLEDERRVPNLFVDQLVLIEDVTKEVVTAIGEGKTNEEKVELKNAKIEEIQNKYNEETGLVCRVTSLYSGGKYSLYGYKRYDDVRAVFVVERIVGLYGGDPDNFTYPRYDADFAFLRVYEDGKPLKTENFFKFSKNGPELGEPLFVVGNPGTTQKLNTYAQLEYARDITMKNRDFLFSKMVEIHEKLAVEYPEKADYYNGNNFLYANSAKVFKYLVKALRDPVFMARKGAFEKDFKNAVMAKPELKEKYGHIWKGIESTRSELREFGKEIAAYRINNRLSPQYLVIARNLVNLAHELRLVESERSENYKEDQLEATINGLFPANFDEPFELYKTALNADYLALNLGVDNEIFKNLYGDKKGEAGAKYALANSKITTAEDVIALANEGADAILNSGDPFIGFVNATEMKLAAYNAKSAEILNTEQALADQLGQALFAVYGTSIPPDATFTLRISDGVMKSYEYNGTTAPVNTTFYGLYDRYYSHQKLYPWKLPERWVDYGPELDLETPYNFITSHDIVGGSSGSAVINKNREIVGVAFDGNVESIPGNYIYIPDSNRMVSVSSGAIIEILQDLLHYDRLSSELKTGKMVEQVIHEAAEVTE